VGNERVVYRWWVLANAFLIFITAFGMGWTYIVMLVPQVLRDLGLAMPDWGSLWAAISLGTVLFAIVGGVLRNIEAFLAQQVVLEPGNGTGGVFRGRGKEFQIGLARGADAVGRDDIAGKAGRLIGCAAIAGLGRIADEERDRGPTA